VVDFINIFLRIFRPNRIRNFFLGEWSLANGEERSAKSKQFLANFCFNFVGEIERRIFRQTPFAGNFSLGEKSLMKLTPGVNFTKVLRTTFAPTVLRL
jgi:hypothetical protein